MKFSFWQLEIFSIAFGIIVAIASCFWDGGRYIVWAYLAGALYAFAGCFFLEWILENAGSLFWNEGHEPKKAKFWMYPIIPLLLPATAIAAFAIMFVFVGFLLLSSLKYWYDRGRGYIKSA